MSTEPPAIPEPSAAVEEAVDAEALVRELDTTLALVDADKINLAYAIYVIIERARPDDRPSLLRHAAHNWDSVQSSGEYKPKPVISADELDELKSTYGKVVDGLLDMQFTRKPPEDEFYKELDALIHNPVFRTDQSRAFALYWTLIDNRTPYFQIEQGLRLSDDDFIALGRKLRTETARVRFILASKFDQRSEEADVLLRELDALEGPERVRVMAYILHNLRQRATRLALALSELDLP
jgi:hypothetical protein